MSWNFTEGTNVKYIKSSISLPFSGPLIRLAIYFPLQIKIKMLTMAKKYGHMLTVNWRARCMIINWNLVQYIIVFSVSLLSFCMWKTYIVMKKCQYTTYKLIKMYNRRKKNDLRNAQQFSFESNLDFGNSCQIGTTKCISSLYAAHWHQ